MNADPDDTLLPPPDAEPPPDAGMTAPGEAALEGALVAAFPASDPMILHQWLERHREDLVPLSEEERYDLYLKGPTGFSA